MEIMTFPSRDAAERHLRTRGYVFVGAPDRWRLVAGGTETYARIARHNGLWVVAVGLPRER